MNLEPSKYTGSILQKEVYFKYTTPEWVKWMGNWAVYLKYTAKLYTSSILEVSLV